MTTNEELALRVYKEIMDEGWVRVSKALVLDIARLYDAAKLEAMQPEVKKVVRRLECMSLPDPQDEREVMNADFFRSTADLIKRLATTQEKK